MPGESKEGTVPSLSPVSRELPAVRWLGGQNAAMRPEWLTLKAHEEIFYNVYTIPYPPMGDETGGAYRAKSTIQGEILFDGLFEEKDSPRREFQIRFPAVEFDLPVSQKGAGGKGG